MAEVTQNYSSDLNRLTKEALKIKNQGGLGQRIGTGISQGLRKSMPYIPVVGQAATAIGIGAGIGEYMKNNLDVYTGGSGRGSGSAAFNSTTRPTPYEQGKGLDIDAIRALSGARQINTGTGDDLREYQGADIDKDAIEALSKKYEGKSKPLPEITELSSSSPAPDGSGATGTQLSMRQPTPEEMLAFLGGAQNLAMYGRAASDLVPGMGIREADVPLSRLANEDDMEDMLYGGRTPEEINRLQRGEALDEVVIDSDYELSDAEKGQKSTEDIKKMVRERNAFRKAAKPETQTKKTVERPQVDGKTDYMVPYRNAEMMRRGAFLDADSSMQGLKNREMQRGYITAGGKKYSITNDFLKSNDPADLRAELSGEEVSQLKAQELLNDNIKNVIAPSATTQNPMLGIGEGFDATDGKTTKYMDVSTANFAENNATPAEMDESFSPLDYDADLWRDRRFLKGDSQHGIISDF